MWTGKRKRTGPGQTGAWVSWGGKALLGCFCRVSGEGRRKKAEFRCGQEHKSPGYLSFPPTTTGPQHNPQGLRRGAALEDKGSRNEW